MVLADRVQETTTSVGTGPITLAGAVFGFQGFSVVGNGNQTYYTINHVALGDWEVGIGTYNVAGTLSRDTVLGSSNANAKVNFKAGTKQVFITYPAGKALHADGAYDDPPWITKISGAKVSGQITNVVYTTGSYDDPSWLVKVSGAKISGAIANVVYTTGSYDDPSWLVKLSGAKISGAIANVVYTTGSYDDPSWLTKISGAKVSGAIANVVYTTGSYSDPSWISSLSATKITGTFPDVVYTTGSYSDPSWILSLDAMKITGTLMSVVYETNSYSDPTWITSLSGSKITGAITDVVYTTGSYDDPSWITSISGAKVSGAITNVVYNATSATTNAIALFTDSTGKNITDSGVTITTVAGSGTTTIPTSKVVSDGLALKANDADVVKLTGNQNINGAKSFLDYIGVGVSAVATSVVYAVKTFTGTNDVIFGFYFIPTLQPVSAGIAELYGLSSYPQMNGNNNASVISGAIFRPVINHGSGATLTNCFGFNVVPNFSASSQGTVTNLRMAFLRNAGRNAASTEVITTQTQLYMEAPTRGTTNWAIYSEGGNSYHAGDVYIGTVTGSGRLTVRGSGTSSAANGLTVEDSGGTDNFVVRNDGGYAFRGGTVGLAQTGYTTFTNLVTDRTCDANATTVEELADILGTLIVDLKAKGIIAA